jgi:hypothetical protein
MIFDASNQIQSEGYRDNSLNTPGFALLIALIPLFILLIAFICRLLMNGFVSERKADTFSITFKKP